MNRMLVKEFQINNATILFALYCKDTLIFQASSIDLDQKIFDISDYIIQGQYRLHIFSSDPIVFICNKLHQYQKNIDFEIQLAPYAQSKLLGYFFEFTGTFNCMVTFSEKSQFTYEFFIVKSSIETQLKLCISKKDAQVNVCGAYLLSDMNKTTIQTQQLHEGEAGSQSSVNIVGAVLDSAHIAYTGSIVIAKEAIRTQAHQYNKNIVLSEKASVKAKPGLKVLNNDVACSHGSATGKIDVESIFYAQSRGISAEQAKKIIISGLLYEALQDKYFFQKITDAVSLMSVKSGDDNEKIT